MALIAGSKFNPVPELKSYEKLKKLFLETWAVILPLMDNAKPFRATVQDHYMELNHVSDSVVLRINSSKADVSALYDISYNTDTEYFSTFTDTSIRIAHWKPDHPRYYALYDPTHGIGDMKFTFIEYPCDDGYYFQRMTQQNVLEYEDYELWDTEAQVMHEELRDHPAKSTALMGTGDISSEKVLELCMEFFELEAKRNAETST